MADVRLTATNPEDSSVVPVACDASGRLLLQELPAIDTIDGDLTVTGKGSFAGGKSIIGNDGSAQFAQGAVDIYANGTVEFTQSVNFASRVIIDRPVGELLNLSTESKANYIFAGPTSTPGTAGLSIGTDLAKLPEDNNAFIGIDGSATFAGGDISLNADGSATFVSNPGATAASAGNHISATGLIRVARVDDGPVFEGGKVGDGKYNVKLAADGSATFAGNKAGFTAEGYLWCTTRRGDTVILDATSNGLASWVEYTPTTRIDDIRDRLNAIRGDSPEMPADTP